MKASIIIPSYNAKDRLYLNLVALNEQSYNGDDVEVIVIDNGSTDNTMDMLRRFKLKYPLETIRVEKNRGIAYGRNMGVLKAKGDILIFHDSDMLASKKFVEQHINAHKKPNLVVCGLFWRRIFTFYYKKLNCNQMDMLTRIRRSLGLERLSLYWDGYPLISEEQIRNDDLSKYSYDLEFGFISDLRDIVSQYGREFTNYFLPWRFFITNNLSVERKRVIEVGMFDTNIIRYGYEDYDLGIRLYKSGSKFYMAEYIESLHQEHPPNYQSDDLVVNINYICEKYDNIYFIDVALVCLSDILNLDKTRMNNITGDIYRIIQHEEYNGLLRLFLDLLQIIRKKNFAPDEEGSNEYFMKMAPEMGSYVKMALDLQRNLGCDYFIQGLILLFRTAYDIEFDKLMKANR